MENVKDSNLMLVYATKDEQLSQEIEKFVNDSYKGEIVRLENRLLDDYEKAVSNEENHGSKTLSEFVSNKENQAEAERKAVMLWNLLTKGADLEKAKERIFSRSEIVKRTSLSHGKLRDLLELFSLFGLIEYVTNEASIIRYHEFKFVFSEEARQEHIHTEVLEDLAIAEGNIARYLSAFKDEEAKKNAKEQMMEYIKQLFEIQG